MLGDADAHKLQRLSRYFGKPVAELDALLPSLRWVQQGSFYTVKSAETGQAMPLHLPGGLIVTDIDARLVDDTDRPDLVEAARDLTTLMTDFLPYRVQRILIGNALPVVISGESFNLRVSRLGDCNAQATLSDGSQLALVKQFDERKNAIFYKYAGEGSTPTGKSELTGTDKAGAPAIAPVVLLSSQDPVGTDADYNVANLYEGLFGLGDDEAHLAQLIKLEPGLDDYSVFFDDTSKRRPAPNAQMNEERANKRRHLDPTASASTCWENYCAEATIKLPTWEQLGDTKRLQLRAAVSSLPSNEDYAAQRQAAEDSGTQLHGPEIVQGYRVERFQTMAVNLARRVLDVAERTYSIHQLENRIRELGETKNRQLLRILLNQAVAKPELVGCVPGTLAFSAALGTIASTSLLRAVEQKVKAGEEKSSAGWLKMVLNPICAGANDPNAPDPETSNACMTALAEALGHAYTTLGQAKRVIRDLTGVNLAFHNAGNRQRDTPGPGPDNPIPATGKYRGLHGRFNNLKVAAHQKIYAKHFKESETVSDRGPSNAAHAIMALLETLEAITDTRGRPRERKEAEPWFKELCGRALGTRVDNFSDLLNLEKQQIAAVFKAFDADPEVRRAISAGNVAQLHPLISSMTGITLIQKKKRGR